MDKNKLKGSSFNRQNEVLNFLKSDLPEVFSEGKIDCKKLKQTLGEDVDDSNERYGLSWNGKSNCFRVIQEQTTATLKPAKDESVDFDKTQNLFIEGDNLEVLKVLQRSYYGKVKMIYIDPPYNTGGDFIYNDNFRKTKNEEMTDSGELDGNGDLTRIDGLSLNRKDSNGHFHSDWLNMMYPRLFLARNLLRQDGVIFVSIDDNEVKNLRMIMDEIFGEENFVASITIKGNPRGRDYGGVARMHDYLLVYAKSEETEINNLFDENKTFPYKDERGEFEIRELRNRNIAFNSENRPNLYYPFYVNPNKQLDNGFFEISLDRKDGWIEVNPKESQGYKTVWRWGKDKSRNNLNKEIAGKAMQDGGYQIIEKYREKTQMARSVWDDKLVNTEKGTLLVKELFGKKVFPFPKPVEMIQRIVEMGTNKDDKSIILDFFAGSGTTANAVMKQNEKDGGNRKWVCVQLPELCDEESEAYKAGYKSIAEIGKERIRRVGRKIEKESKSKVDLGCKVLKLEKSNFKIWHGKFENTENLLNAMAEFVDNVQKGSKEENILFELILKSGLDLNVSVEEKEFSGEKYYSLDGGKLIVYLGKKITKELSEEIQEAKPEKFICLDGCFQNNDQLKTNVSLQMEQEKIDFKVI